MGIIERTMKKVMFREWERSRNARILAGDNLNENQEEGNRVQNSRTTRPKTKLDALKCNLNVPKKQMWKGKEPMDRTESNVEWRSIRVPGITYGNRQGDHTMRSGSQSPLPPKETLVLVLQILQSKDIFGLFADPVDSDEVEGYDEIIKEPMNFAMILAKIHEDMYQNLEEFEHDVYLVPENAMFFNSSSSVYFEQACAIHNLARKVLSDLKEDPENFALEYAEPRRRWTRKGLSDDPFRGRPSSSSGLSAPQRGASASHSNVVGKPLAYLPTRSPYYFSFPSSSQINHGHISYTDNLMSFSKERGQIAEMVAKRKLSALNEPSCSNQHASAAPLSIPDNAGTIETNAHPMLRNFFPIPSEKSPAQAAPGKLDHLKSTKTNAPLSFSGFNQKRPAKSPCNVPPSTTKGNSSICAVLALPCQHVSGKMPRKKSSTRVPLNMQPSTSQINKSRPGKQKAVKKQGNSSSAQLLEPVSLPHLPVLPYPFTLEFIESRMSRMDDTKKTPFQNEEPRGH